MKSTTGAHYVGLDHVRALAAFMVFCWHFLHESTGSPVPFGSPPSVFPLALFDQGNIGVALFMVLSGYLFSKLLNGQKILYGPFLWNRFIRLAPLLILVFVLRGCVELVRDQTTLPDYLHLLISGFVLPTWPNGGWSVAVEIHFYLILPVLLIASSKIRWSPAIIIALAIVLRIAIFWAGGRLPHFAYWTIVGRIDQFCFGILAFSYRGAFKQSHVTAAIAFLALSAAAWLFDYLGGDALMWSLHPGLGWIWIVLPTIEGALFSILVAYYDTSFDFSKRNVVSSVLSKIGAYSYSIYLLHFFFVFGMARFINSHVADISTFYRGFLFAAISFLPMVAVGALSFNLFEKRFLKFRTIYTAPNIEAHLPFNVRQAV